MSDNNVKRVRNTTEEFIKVVNGPGITSIEDVATKLNLKPDSVKQRIYSLKRDFQIPFRELPMTTAGTSRNLKGNPERIAKLQEMAASLLKGSEESQS